MARKRFIATERDKEIAERFITLREEKDINGKLCSQRMLAEKIGIVYSRISDIESASCQASIEDLKKYHKYFNVPYEYLLGDSDNRYYLNMDNGENLGLSDKAQFVLKDWNKCKSRDLEALNILLEKIYDIIEQNPDTEIRSLFNHIWVYLYGEFEHNVESFEPFDSKILNDPLFQTNKDTLYISEKGSNNRIAYDLNKIMEAFVLESITDFIRSLKKGENN